MIIVANTEQSTWTGSYVGLPTSGGPKRLACDMRFASRQSALFGNPEVGVGLVPGGGALEWLPRLVGRSRALEIVLSGDDFDADIAERYGWVNRTLDDANLDSFDRISYS